MKNGNCFLLSLLFSAIGLFSFPISGHAQEVNRALEGKKVLFVFGGWDGHEPVQCRDLFVPWLKSEKAEVFVYDNLDCYKDSVLMGKIDLIIQVWTMGKIEAEQEKGLLKAVRRGVGIAGWHGGLGDSFRDNVDYQFMVGGQWVAHPGGVIPYDVNITDKTDPVTRGIKDFHMKSEQYYVHVDPNVKVLATTMFSKDHSSWIDGAVIPVVWKKAYGKGRVFYSSLGHVAADFNVPEAFEIMKRGIRWSALSLYEKEEKWLNPIYKK
ncbi:MAG: ThuA domain-containing protein [Tannerellaceae bacterium]